LRYFDPCKNYVKGERNVLKTAALRVLDFRCVVPFRNQILSKSKQNSHFLTTWKITGG